MVVGADGRIGGLSPRMLLLVLRAIAQLIFDLLLRPTVVDHTIDIAGAGRIRLAAEHVLVCGSHDRLCLVARHRSIGPTTVAFPFVGAARATRTSLLAAPALISLAGLVPAMV